MSEIICDTNIWYELGANPPSEEFLKKNSLIGTFHSIDELSRTPVLISHYDSVQKAIQSLMTYSKRTIYEPPFIYLKRQNKPDFHYNPASKLRQILLFTKAIANGENLIEEKITDYEKHCAVRRADLQSAADFFNSEASKIKPKIKDNEKHRKEDSIPVNRNFISFCVANEAKASGLDEGFNWPSIELFESVLKIVFNDLETGAVTLTANDWYDMFNLIYVRPGQLYWTKEKKWINFIKRAGMDKYLFIPTEN